MIIDLLKQGNVSLQVEAKTWQEAGRIAGGLLVDSGKVEAEYVDAMISSVEQYGPYIVLVKGVALFHARPENGVKEICMSLITLKDPVIFNADEKDPVKIAFAFGAIDHQSHLEALSELMVLFGNQEVLDQIGEIETEEALMSLLNKVLKEKDHVI